MTEETGKKTTFSWSSEDDGTRTSAAERVRIIPVRRWTIYLLVVPAFVAVALLAAFFFAAFVALSILGAVGLGLWFWWVRRRFRKLARTRTLDGECVVIEETQVIEKKNDGVN
ncbi:MAG: hypothetical protein ACREV4_12595 [Gammaproteobacteria bacterium]